MIATQNAQAKSKHPLSRFVTPEDFALLLKLETEDIYRIDCWRYVIHVVGKGVSTFASYADLTAGSGSHATHKARFCAVA